MRIINIAVFISLVFTTYSCSKIHETIPDAGSPVPYETKGMVPISRLVDSLSDLSIYRVIYANSDAAHYMDSARMASGKNNMPFTLFAPNDAAFVQAGIDLAMARMLTQQQCNDLVLYLLVPGRILTDSEAPVEGGTALSPVIPTMMVSFQDKWGNVTNRPYYFTLDLAWRGQEVLLNGNPSAAASAAINASDGALYLLDTVIRKPTRSVYEELAADTSYSFYLAALEKSSSVYLDYKVGISPGDRNEELFFATADPFNNYLAELKQFIPAPAGAGRFATSYIVFAPDNNAFRKAGFSNIEAIAEFIDKSYVTTQAYRNVDHAYPLTTNMDSVLFYSFITPLYSKDAGLGMAFYYEQKVTNVFNTLLYTNSLESSYWQQGGISAAIEIDFYDWATFDDNTWQFAENVVKSNRKWLFRSENGMITLRRGDMPDGPIAHLVPAHSNITALNGVIHRIDNLLLP